jgi:hypothetical protein
LIGHAQLKVNISGFNTGRNTDLPEGYAIAINDDGSFFQKVKLGEGELKPGGYTGGTNQAQVFILLHELGNS